MFHLQLKYVLIRIKKRNNHTLGYFGLNAGKAFVNKAAVVRPCASRDEAQIHKNENAPSGKDKT